MYIMIFQDYSRRTVRNESTMVPDGIDNFLLSSIYGLLVGFTSYSPYVIWFTAISVHHHVYSLIDL